MNILRSRGNIRVLLCVFLVSFANSCKERLEAIIPFMRKFYSDNPAMRYMDKWVVDLTEGAKHQYNL